MKSLGLGLAILAVWLLSAWTHPKWVCWWCNGGGETSPAEGSRARRDCWRCGGSKRIKRLSARVPKVVTLVVAVLAVAFLHFG